MTPEDLNTLRKSLPALGERVDESTALLLAQYCRLYQINFAEYNEQLVHRIGTVQSGKHTLAVQQWLQPGAHANLLLVHGYFDHTGIFGKLVVWAIQQNCNVTIFDLPGHGLSSGEPAVIDDFADYSQSIKDVLASVDLPDLPLWVMGQSTGGAALIDFARKYDWPFAATVLLAPLIRPAGWFGVNLAQRFIRPFVETIPRGFSVNSSDAEFLQFVKTEPLQSHRMSLRWISALRRWLRSLEFGDLGVGPALIIQGDMDGTVAWQYNVPKLRVLFPNSQVEFLSGAGHQLANESQSLRNSYLQLVASYLHENGVLPAVQS